jgi:hypothetical protein
MKNLKCTLFATMILFATTLTAQQTITPSADDDHRDEFGFGLKAGVNFANVYDEEGNDFVANGRTGFFAGAFVSVPFSQMLGLQPEVNYSQKGYTASQSVLGVPFEYERTTSYLDIPLLLQIKPHKNFTILVGPQFSYLLDTKDELKGVFEFVEDEEITEDNYKKNIIGGVIGFEANWKGLLFTARGNFDFTESDEEGNTFSPRYKNQVFQLGLGYTFY